MNHELFQLKLTCASTQLKEAVGSLIHTILFHRAFGPVTPTTIDCQYLNFSYSRVANVGDKIDKLVEDKINQLYISFNNNNNNTINNNNYNVNNNNNRLSVISNTTSGSGISNSNYNSYNNNNLEGNEYLKNTHINTDLIQKNAKHGRMAISFYDTRQCKNMLGFYKLEKFVWEEWIIDINLVSPMSDKERIYYQHAVEKELVNNCGLIMRIVNEKHEHIPAVMDNNPFPFDFDITIPESEYKLQSLSNFMKKILLDSDSVHMLS